MLTQVLECPIGLVLSISMSSGGGGGSKTVAGLAGSCDGAAKEGVGVTVVGEWFDCDRLAKFLLAREASKHLISSSNLYLHWRAHCQDSKVLDLP